MSKNDLCKTDKHGNLIFPGDKKLKRMTDTPESLWHRTSVLIIILAACAVTDFFSFRQIFDAVLYDSPILRYCCIIGLLCAFEIAPVYLAHNIKKKSVGFNVGRLSIIVPLLILALAIAANIYLRVVTAPDAFPDLSNTSTSAIGGGTNNGPGVSHYAGALGLFMGLLPIITAAICFTATYSMTNPLLTAKRKLEKLRDELTTRCDQLEAALKETDEDDYLNRLLADDEARYNAALGKIEQQRRTYYDHARMRINEYLANPAAIGYHVAYATGKEDKNDAN